MSDHIFWMGRPQDNGSKTFLLSGNREEAVASVCKMVGIGHQNMKAHFKGKTKHHIKFASQGSHRCYGEKHLTWTYP